MAFILYLSIPEMGGQMIGTMAKLEGQDLVHFVQIEKELAKCYMIGGRWIRGVRLLCLILLDARQGYLSF